MNYKSMGCSKTTLLISELHLFSSQEAVENQQKEEEAQPNNDAPNAMEEDADGGAEDMGKLHYILRFR